MRRPKRSTVVQAISRLEKEQIREKRRLRGLELQIATLGMYAPPSIAMEMEEVQQKINRIAREIRRLGALTVELDPQDAEYKAITKPFYQKQGWRTSLVVVLICISCPFIAKALLVDKPVFSCNINIELLRINSVVDREAELVIFSDLDRNILIESNDYTSKLVTVSAPGQSSLLINTDKNMHSVAITPNDCMSVIATPGRYILTASEVVDSDTYIRYLHLLNGECYQVHVTKDDTIQVSSDCQKGLVDKVFAK